MHIMVLGLNHRTAPVELRERLAFSDGELEEALTRLRHTKSILECTILSTCNRMELYAVCDQLHTGEYYLKTFLENWFGIPREQFVDHLYVKQNEEAVRHLFLVACGLDSMIIGETQILGQVKSAFLTAQKHGATGTLFNTLFKQAVTLGKRVHAETEIGQNAVSVSYAAVELGKKLFDGFSGKTVLLVGAGKMGELTAKHFREAGADRVIVTNRTLEKAEEVAARFDGEARPFDRLVDSLREADIVVTSTGSPDAVIRREMVSEAVRSRQVPLFLIDIAVPRDVEPSVHDLEQVYLYNIDDLEGIVEANLVLRRKETEKVEAWIEKEILRFEEWLQTLGVVPLISALREKAIAIQEETMRSIERKLPDLTERERRVIRKHTKSIVNQLLRDPILRIKEMAAGPDREEVLELFVQLFALEDRLLSEEETVRDRESLAARFSSHRLGRPAYAGADLPTRS